jgi:hypothetical protein
VKVSSPTSDGNWIQGGSAAANWRNDVGEAVDQIGYGTDHEEHTDRARNERGSKDEPADRDEVEREEAELTS